MFAMTLPQSKEELLQIFRFTDLNQIVIVFS
jgi:hypothetical protein